ncbi:hypothetical protein EUGRSUZ_F02333 [Eucalyptus grandis]|uniref:Uncharacterized protein n=2 Tax=Eucalyptus grandis TaxID=71139 RepID=A0ACC3KGY6_EUCGR|nr:hypothetical protein EUGRSUZ_F02333 [Eucalyptus grandis]
MKPLLQGTPRVSWNRKSLTPAKCKFRGMSKLAREPNPLEQDWRTCVEDGLKGPIFGYLDISQEKVRLIIQSTDGKDQKEANISYNFAELKYSTGDRKQLPVSNDQQPRHKN